MKLEGARATVYDHDTTGNGGEKEEEGGDTNRGTPLSYSFSRFKFIYNLQHSVSWFGS